MCRDERLIQRAAALAATSVHPKWKLAALVIRGGSIVSASVNVKRNPPRLTQGGPGTTWHAEEAALRSMRYQADRAEGCTIYVARVNKRNQMRLGRPCMKCFALIVSSGIKTIVYSVDDCSFATEKVSDLQRRMSLG